MENFSLDSDAYNLQSALKFVLFLIILRTTILTLYKVSKPQKKKRVLSKTIPDDSIRLNHTNSEPNNLSKSSSTLIDETESQREQLLRKLKDTNDLDEYLDTQVELEALKYKNHDLD